MNRNFYQNCLTDDLQEQVASQLELLTSEQLSLNEEVAILKARAADVIKAWSDSRAYVKVVEKQLREYQDSGAGDEDTLNNYRGLVRIANLQVHNCGEKMADVMKLQKDLVLSAIVADTKTQQTFTQNTVMLFLNAVLDLAHEFWNKGDRESIEVMTEFEKQLRSRIVFQEADEHALGVEYEFDAMMDTVPKAPLSLTEPTQG